MIVSFCSFAKKKPVKRPVRAVSKVAHDTLGAPLTTADSLIFEATKHLGKLYRRGSKGPNAFDCSGFTSYVYKQLGFDIGCSSRDQFLQGVKVGTDQVHKGDLVFFTGRNVKAGIGHVGIVMDVDPKNHSFKFIHAASSGISIDKYPGAAYYTVRYKGLRRLISYDDNLFTFKPDSLHFEIKPLDIKNVKEKPGISGSEFGADVFCSAYHKVVAGDNLFKIANSYNCSVDDLIKWNNLKKNQKLVQGSVLVIKTKKSPGDYLAESESEINENGKDLLVRVKHGQDINSISKTYKASVDDIVRWNNLKSRSVVEGQNLKIRPTEEVIVPDVREDGYVIHTVSQGDNLFKLASIYRTSVKEISELNGLKNNSILVGQKLKLKEGSVLRPAANAVVDNGITHTVRPGETMASIASDFSCTVDDLKSWNHKTNSNIRPGLILKVRKSEGAEEYIAQRTFSEDDDLPSENEMANLSDNNESLYSIVNESARELGTETQNDGDIIYVIKGGDNLRAIGAKHGCTSGDLIRWNNLKSYKLRPGQKLVIKRSSCSQPAQSRQPSSSRPAADKSVSTTYGEGTDSRFVTYVVKSGDNLHRISLKYKCKVDQIKEWNGMNDINLRVGQKLKIYTNVDEAEARTESKALSVPETENMVTYVVANGDNLYNIGLKYGVKTSDLMEWNNLTSNRLRIGQKLVIRTSKKLE